MKFIVIEGNIGSGKTTLAQMLAKDFNAKLILEEFDDNPFLPKFYQDNDRYSFPLEISLLIDRYEQIKKEIVNNAVNSPFVIADYYFSKTAIFAKKNLKKEEYRLFLKIFDIISGSLPRPDLYIYLQANTDKLLGNIKKRGRDYEKAITLEYLEKISNGYADFTGQINSFPILTIDINSIDFVINPAHYDILKSTLLKSDYKLGQNRIILP